jgi:ribonuclease D
LIPIGADAQPTRRQKVDQPLGDHHRASLVKSAMVAEARQEQLQGLALDHPFAGDIVDDDMGEVRLAGHRAERGEFGRREAHDIVVALRGRRHAFQHRILGPVCRPRLVAQLSEAGISFV